MDKIYSRRRIKIPKIQKPYMRKTEKIISMMLMLLVTVLTAYTIKKAIDPMLRDLCIQTANRKCH